MKYIDSSHETDLLYGLVGDAEWLPADLPANLSKNIKRWLNEGVIVCTRERSRRTRPKYRMSRGALLHYERKKIMTDSAYLVSLVDSGKTLCEIQKNTGINYRQLRNRYKELKNNS